MLQAPVERIDGETFNIGSNAQNCQLGPLAEQIRDSLPVAVEIGWYGDPDHRSYRVGFAKVEALGWQARHIPCDGALEIFARLEAGEIERTSETITLDWYQQLSKWHRIIKDIELHGGIVDIQN
jgi:hypothetical protein